MSIPRLEELNCNRVALTSVHIVLLFRSPFLDTFTAAICTQSFTSFASRQTLVSVDVDYGLGRLGLVLAAAVAARCFARQGRSVAHNLGRLFFL